MIPGSLMQDKRRPQAANERVLHTSGGLGEMKADVQGLGWIGSQRIDAAHSDDATVVVDFSNVQRINTQQLGELIRLHRSVHRAGRQLVLENVPESVLQVLAMTRLDRLLRINLDAQTSSLLLRPTRHCRQRAMAARTDAGSYSN